MAKNRKLILANGESYVSDVLKPGSSRTPEPPRDFDEARDLVRSGIRSSLEEFASLRDQKKITDEAVFCMRLHPDATAKSYDPAAIFAQVPELRGVGSRMYRASVFEVAKTDRIATKIEKNENEVEGRLVFVQGAPSGFERLVRNLEVPESRLTNVFKNEIRRIERFDLLLESEQILGFAKKWEQGRVELVFHPSRSTVEGQKTFVFELFEECGVDWEKSKVRQYAGGPTFVSSSMTRDSLELLAGANPLRAAHPLDFRELEDIRNASSVPAPQPSDTTSKSTIKVGMFDGGIDENVDALKGHVEVDTALEIKTPPDPVGLSHGTAVAGMLLYGKLNGLDDSCQLPPPSVFVVSIRALPTSDPNDSDLYEAIDVIENAVPQRKDVKVFNISFGPRGPILDDSISRFTYVLDSLAERHKVAFFVAVGNDGRMKGLDRIQSPADLVNGVGVGAYSLNGNGPIRAPYSCIGPGRECAKNKPDFAAFGGCENTPIHLLSTQNGEKKLTMGTSFASPDAARIGAVGADIFERANPLLARALLLHTAKHPRKTPDWELGHGCIVESPDDLLYGPEKGVTTVFQGEVLLTKYVKLPIPFPNDLEIPGYATITWTIGALVPIDPSHPGDYTGCCIQDTLYPNSNAFRFSKVEAGKRKTRKVDIVNDAAMAGQLLSDGWAQASFPESVSGNQYLTESSQRLDCKWEPMVRRSKRMSATRVVNPFLVLHGIPRNNTTGSFDYVAVVTIEAPKYEGDLYSDIRTRFSALAPIRIRSEAEIRIQI